MLHAQTELQSLLRVGDQCDTWEMFCAPGSWLTQACEAYGLKAHRINLACGYNLYDPKSYQQLRERFHHERPRRIWVSARCTYWCPWTALNYQTEERREQLEKYRRRERAMFKLLIPFRLEMLQLYPETELFWEWPTRCYGWQEPWLLYLRDELLKLDREWPFARVDDCRYDLKSQRGVHLQKRWTIGTTSNTFFQFFRNKTCIGSHDHDHIQGLETSRIRSAYFPWKLCRSIAQRWRHELDPQRWLERLHSPLAQHLSEQEQCHALQLDAMAGERADPTADELRLWKVQLLKYSKTAGHPNNYNLARIIKESGKAKWQVDAALRLECDDCKALKLGGSSSGQIPPAAMRSPPAAWEAVGMDTTDWIPPNSKGKYKLLVMMDLATHFKVVTIIKEFGLNEMQTESWKEVRDAVCKCWLSDKPRMRILVPDNAGTMIGDLARSSFSDMGIQIETPAVKEPWSHGMVELCVQEIKTVASKMALSYPDIDAATILALPTHALNSTETVRGFSPYQWVYGHKAALDEDQRQLIQLTPSTSTLDFTKMMNQRKEADVFGETSE